MVEIEGLFKEESQYAESGTHGEDGWRWAENRNLASVQVMIEAIENGVDPIGSGENSRKCLEIAIALRESHRRGRTPVRLPFEDRSLRIVPPMLRWLNRKETVSIEDYRTSIGNWKLG